MGFFGSSTRMVAKMVYATFIVIFLMSVSFSSAAAANDDTLELLQVMIRHGNRTSTNVFDQFVPWYMETFSPFLFGQLTAQGRQQMYDVGKYIRERYSNFLPEEFSYTDIAVICTQAPRVQESSAVAMTAMFPPKSKQKWQQTGLGAEYTPIACDYVPPSQDILLEPDSTDCPRYKNISAEFYQSPAFIKQYNELTLNESINKYIQLSLNMTAEIHVQELGVVWENLAGLQNMGLPIPDWAKPVYPEPTTSIYATYYGMVYATPELIRFSAGEYLKEILEIATLLEKGELYPKSRKMFAYIGHDKTIVPLLVALGLETQPPMCTYGAAFIMELHRNKSTSEIGYKFLYRNETWSDPVQYTVPGCQEICPLSYVKNYVKQYIPTKPFFDYC